MARHRAERPDEDDTVEETTDPTGPADPDDELDDDTDDEADDGGAEETARSEAADEWWSDVRVDVVELALPSGVGYTLRAYRMSDEVAPAEEAEEEPAEEEAPPVPKKAAKAEPKAKGKGKGKGADEEEEEPAPSGKRGKRRAAGKKRDEEPEEEDLEDEELDEEELEDEDLDDEELDEEAEAEPEPEEIPTFLAHDGRLLLFRTPEALVSYVRSGAPNDLAVIDTWDQVVSGIKTEFVTPLPDDKYELDLVVDNLRGGHDAWEPELVISAGEVARDLGYALRIEAVLTALSPESPLDDLDEAMRAAAGGGLGAFFARRRLKKIGAQQAALAWRTIIGKITTATDWRD